MQNVTHVLTNEQSELRADTAEASRRRLNARANIGLDQVDNTSDADKPISSATQDALDSKMDVDNGTYLKSAEVSGNGYTLTIRPNNGDVIEFQGGGIVETVQADWAENSPSDPSFIKNKPDLSGYATTSAMDTALGQKQDTIDDLNTIRSGAAAGATAVQPSVLDDYATTSDLATGLAGKQETIDDLSTIREGASAGATAVQPAALSAYATTSDVSNALADKQDVISDLSTIREGASSGATAVQPESLATVATTGNYEDLNGSPDMSTYATTNALNDAISGIRQVPVSEPADLNKVLTVNGSGTPVWAPAQGGGGGGASVNDVTVNGTSVVDSNGVGVVIVPTKTSDLQNDSGFITSVPVTGVEVDGTSVVNGQGVAEINLPAQAQANWDESDSSDPSYIQNKPTIPAAQVNADWTASSGVAQILNKPSIPLATSDLTNDSGYITASDVPAAQEQADWDESDSSDPAYIKNKPTIPAAQVNADWTASSGVAEILHKPTIPSATSDLTNDSGFITTSDVPAAQEQADWNESDTTDPAYIKNKPTIPAAQVNADWTASSGVAEILHKPSIPSATSDLTNDSGFITASDVPSAQAQADWDESDSSDPSYIKNKPTIPAAQVNSDWNASSGVAQILNKPSIPTATSDLTNDSGFITSSDIPAQAQANWNEMDTSDPSYIQNKPTIPAAQVNSDWTASSGVAEILHKPNIPSATSDLTNDSGFITSSDVPAAQEQADWNESDTTDPAYIKNKPTIPAAQVNADWNSSTGVSKILNKPSIPTNTSDLNNDSGFITVSDIPAQVQADWTETDNTKASFVKNKPTIPTVPVTDVTVDGTSVLNNGTAEVVIPVKDVTVGGSSVVSNQGVAAITIPAQVQADWTESDNTKASFVKNKPTLATVATSGSYGDLSNAPTLASVATSGDYDDLTNKPTIPAAQVNSDWDAVSGVAKILNKPSLATVATTGSYDDLIDKPTIPTVPVTDVTVNGSSVVSNGTAAVVVPAQAQADWTETDNTKASFVKNKPSLATVATTGSYTDLSNTPTIPTVPVTDVTVDGTSVLSNGTAAVVIPVKDVTVGGTSVVTNQGVAAITIPSQVQSDWTETDNSVPSYIANKPNLATVATSGSYGDLSNTPTLATVATSGDYGDLTNKPTIPSVPVQDVTVDGTSVLNNGTAEVVIPVKDVTVGGSSVVTNQGVAAITIPSQVQADWTEADTSVPSYIANKPSLATVATTGSYSDLSNTPTLATVATTGSYDDLIDKPTIPTVPVTDVTVNGSSVVSNGTAAVVVPAQAQADWTESDNTKPSFVKNKPSLATVATTGSYTDLSNTPTIPSVPVTDVTVDGTSVLSNGTAAVVIPVKDVTVGGSSVVTNQGVAAITIPTQVQADWTESDNSDPSFIANKPDLTVKADKVTSATSGDFAALDSNGNLTDSGVSANSFKTVQNAVNDPTASGTATSFIDSISQNSNGVITATKKTIPADLVSRTVYVGQDCVYNDKEFWGNSSTVADVIDDYANQTVTDYRGNSVSLVRFQAEYDSNRFRIAAIDETPGTVDYNRKIGGQIIDLMRSDFWMSSHPTYDIIKFDRDMDKLFDLLMTGSPMNAYLLLNHMTSTAFITDARREMYMDMIKAYDAWPYADKDTAYADFMAEHALDRFVQVSTTWPLNSWNSYRYVMAGTPTATDKMIFVIRHAERDSDTSVNGDINSTGVTTCTTMGRQVINNTSWDGNTISNYPANDATYYSTEYLRCKHSAQAFASARNDTDFAASDYSGITIEANMLNQYRFFYQPAESGNSTLIRNYSVDPTRLSSSELSNYFGVSSAAEAQEKLSNDYVRVCKEILNKSTARLNMFYTHDFFTLPLAVMASNKYYTFSGSGTDNNNWINYCAGIGMILHPDNTYEVMPVRGKSNGTMTI